MIQIKRIYDPAAAADGQRVLVDRLWPRGVSKIRAALDAWLKDVAPSTELRTWFGHDPARFDEFAVRYTAELDSDPAKRAAVKTLLDMARRGPVTLLYGAKDPRVSHALVLQRYLAAYTR